MNKKIQINKYRALFPKQIKVRITPFEGSGFGARILNFKGSITEGNTFSELIFMINDCVRTILEVPNHLLDSMPEYITTKELSQKFTNI